TTYFPNYQTFPKNISHPFYPHITARPTTHNARLPPDAQQPLPYPKKDFSIKIPTTPPLYFIDVPTP
ncbi:MAG: hypothetical protein K2I24_09245, partial [Duncaniella sp.]|nr:hypothetical protein [Duncaniella sp.]